MTVGTVPDELRVKIDDLVRRDQKSRAIELLEIWAAQYARTSWVMERLGELHLDAKNRVAAGRAFFWSGFRGDNEQHQHCIEEFLATTRRSPLRLVRTLPKRARVALEHMPPTLREELMARSITDAVVDRANRTRPLIYEILIALTLGAIFIVGLVTCIRWLINFLRTVS